MLTKSYKFNDNLAEKRYLFPFWVLIVTESKGSVNDAGIVAAEKEGREALQ